MSKKIKSTKNYYHGKNIPKTDAQHTPMTGEPNTNLDVRNKKTGKFISRRKFDENGNACADLDMPHKGHKIKERHAHDIRKKDRKSARGMTKRELREIKKAERKCKPWEKT